MIERNLEVSDLVTQGGGALGTVAGFFIGGPGGAVAGKVAGSIATRATVRAAANVGDWLARRMRLLELAIAAAEDGDAEEVVERLTESDAGIALLRAVLETAVSTAMEDKLRVLALVLVDASCADSMAGTEQVREIVRILDVLEAPHIALLGAFREAPGLPSECGYRRRTRPQLKDDLPQYKSVLDPLIATCRMCGVLREAELEGRTYGGPAPFIITEVGQEILRYLDRVNETMR